MKLEGEGYTPNENPGYGPAVVIRNLFDLLGVVGSIEKFFVNSDPRLLGLCSLSVQCVQLVLDLVDI